jgi:hypothetical protein
LPEAPYPLEPTPETPLVPEPVIALPFALVPATAGPEAVLLADVQALVVAQVTAPAKLCIASTHALGCVAKRTGTTAMKEALTTRLRAAGRVRRRSVCDTEHPSF